MRLAQRHFHLLAIRICEWVGHASSEQVLFHWACEKIRGARGSPQTDEQLCQTILEKFQRCPGIGSLGLNTWKGRSNAFDAFSHARWAQKTSYRYGETTPLIGVK